MVNAVLILHRPTAACLFVPTSGWQHVKTIERWWKMNQNLRCSNCSFTLSQNWQETQQAADYKFSDVACVAVAAFSCMAGIAVSGFSWTASVLHHRRVLLFHPWCLSSILVYMQSPETPNHSITVIYIFDFNWLIVEGLCPFEIRASQPTLPAHTFFRHRQSLQALDLLVCSWVTSWNMLIEIMWSLKGLNYFKRGGDCSERDRVHVTRCHKLDPKPGRVGSPRSYAKDRYD